MKEEKSMKPKTEMIETVKELKRIQQDQLRVTIQIVK